MVIIIVFVVNCILAILWFYDKDDPVKIPSKVEAKTRGSWRGMLP